jgi:hypothetical protein
MPKFSRRQADEIWRFGTKAHRQHASSRFVPTARGSAWVLKSAASVGRATGREIDAEVVPLGRLIVPAIDRKP